VWLDRGELDKLIAQDAASADAPPAPRGATRDGYREREHSYDNHQRGYDDRRTDYRTQKKKRSIFDVFDFD
jgi:Zn-finger nucleic acid-binding protein